MLPPAGVSPLYHFPWPSLCRRGERREGKRREGSGGKGRGGAMGVRKPQRVSKPSARVRENLTGKAVKDRKKKKEREAKEKKWEKDRTRKILEKKLKTYA
jgi:hypothetical protein